MQYRIPRDYLHTYMEWKREGNSNSIARFHPLAPLAIISPRIQSYYMATEYWSSANVLSKIGI